MADVVKEDALNKFLVKLCSILIDMSNKNTKSIIEVLNLIDSYNKKVRKNTDVTPDINWINNVDKLDRTNEVNILDNLDKIINTISDNTKNLDKLYNPTNSSGKFYLDELHKLINVNDIDLSNIQSSDLASINYTNLINDNNANLSNLGYSNIVNTDNTNTINGTNIANLSSLQHSDLDKILSSYDNQYNIANDNSQNDVDQISILNNYEKNNDYDIIMQRRIDFHLQKNKNLSQPDEDITLPNSDSMMENNVDSTNNIDQCSKSTEEVRIPTITPLSRLNDKEVEELEKSILNQAIYNINEILQIDKSDPSYKTNVLAEADRLLNVWMETNKKYK